VANWESDLLGAYGDSGGSLGKDELTAWQQSVWTDAAWHRVVFGGRRLGKTRGIASILKRGAIPGATTIYASSTVTKARAQLFPYFEELNRNHAAGIELYRGDFRAETKDGGTIQLMGIATEREADKIRGYAKGSPLVVIDEAGTLKENILKYAVEDCAEPATSDWYGRGGSGIILSGNPSRHVGTYWHRLCRGEMGWSVHHGTMWDNPHQPDPDGFLQMLLDKHGWTRQTPKVRREYFGEFCIETDELCYLWDGKITPEEQLPKQGLTIICIDFGVTHPSAWNVIRCVEDQTYVLQSRKEAGLTIHELAAITREMRIKHNAGFIVGDCEDARSILDLNRVHGLPVEGAKKAGKKLSRIWDMASRFRVGTLHLGPDTVCLQNELQTVGWNDDRDDHHESVRDDNCDGLHYGLEYAMQLAPPKKTYGPEKGTPEWMAEEQRRIVRLVQNRDSAANQRRR
jgi:hypothetical protein